MRVAGLVFLLFLYFCANFATGKHKEITSKYYSYRFNRDFLNMSVDGSNKTHLGAQKFWNLKRLSTLKVNIELKSAMSKKVFFDNTLMLCHIRKQRNMNIFLRYFFEMNMDNFNFKVDDMRCPIEKGYYELKARPRPKDNTIFFPSFISTTERVIFTVTMMTTYKGQDEKLFISVESYELKEFDD